MIVRIAARPKTTRDEHIGRSTTPEPDRRSTLLRALTFARLALSAAWATVIFVTDQLAWPPAPWVATNVGPLAAIERRYRHGESATASGAPT